MNKTVKKLATLSWLNFKSHIWLYTKIALAFAVIVFLVCLFSAYAMTLNDTQSNMLAQGASCNYIVSDQPIDNLPVPAETVVVKHYDFYAKKIEWFGYGLEHALYAADVKFIIDGKEYLAYSGASNAWDTLYFYGGNSFITQNDIDELKYVNGSTEYLIGKLPQLANEVVLSEDMLSIYGLDCSEVLGKQIKLATCSRAYDNNFDGITQYKTDDNTVLDTVTVCGVIRRQYFELSGHSASQFCPTVFLSNDNPLFDDEDNTYVNYIYSLSQWLSDSQFASIEQNYNCYYFGKWISGRMQTISNMRTVAVKLFSVVGGALVCSMILMILLMMDKLVAVFSRDCGILLSCGITWKQAKLLLLVLLLSVCIISALLAAALSVAAIYAINAVIRAYYWFTVTTSLATVFALFAVGVAVVVLIALGYMCYIVSVLKTRSVKEFLEAKI